MHELFYEEHEVTEKELQDDVTNDRDNLVPLWQAEARMYSLEQF